MLNLAPWYYRHLLYPNDFIEVPEFYNVKLGNGESYFEANVVLKEKHRPLWIEKSSLYKDCDGSGASEFKNVAVYKAISEALERMAFYYSVDSKQFGFNENPTTTGMAAIPHFRKIHAQRYAMLEAVERLGIHLFNLSKLKTNEIKRNDSIKHFVLDLNLNKVIVSIVASKYENFYIYGFAGGYTLEQSFKKALIELERNRRLFIKNSNFISNKLSVVDESLLFFASESGNEKFYKLIEKSPQSSLPINNKLICDEEIIGPWSKYTTVWRALYSDIYFDCSQDKTYFMF